MKGLPPYGHMTSACSEQSISTDDSVQLVNSQSLFHRDLNLASLKATAGLLKELPLQPEARESDFMEEKTKLFKKLVVVH